MIQELFGMEERKLSSPAVLLLTNCSVHSSSSTPSMSSPNSSTISEPQQNLRCPRCDSSNTKFCYYNNYNLTQPRHFCKTCRRYWTKGGALRNVPIGGGCRKVKPCRSAVTKLKPTTPDITGQELQNSAAAPWNPSYSSQLLDLLINSQFQNPNPNSISKQNSSMFRSHFDADPVGAVYEGALSLDSLGQHAVVSFNSPLSNDCVQYPYHQQPPPPQQHNVYVGEMQSTSGIQELLQRLKTSTNYNYGSLSPSFNTCMPTNSATATATILEPFALSGDNIGNWNSAPLWWFDQQTDLTARSLEDPLY